MRGFKLDQSGDVVIENRQIQLVDGNELLAQTVKTVLGTNTGEWFLEENEGINFRNILIKNPNFDLIRDEIQKGLLQVDSSFVLQKYEYETKGRNLIIHFAATNDSGEEVTGTQTF